MIKKFLFIAMLIIILFSLTGCYSSVDMDKYFYVVGLGLDLADNGLIKVSIQIANNVLTTSNSSSSEPSNSSQYQIYSVEADTIDSAITIFNNYLNKKVNLSHCTVLVISEELCKIGIKEFISTLANNTELRHSCVFLISSSTAYDVLDKVGNSGKVFSSRLYDYLTTSTDYTGYTVDSTFGTFFTDLQNYQRDSIGIYTQVNSDTIQNNGTAVFKEDIYVGHLSVLDTISHLMTTNELKSCTLSLPHNQQENEKIDLDIRLYKDTKINVELINGTPFIDITIYPKGSILNAGEGYDFTTDESIKQIEASANKYIAHIVKDYLYEISKEYNSDIVGFAGIYAKTVATKEDLEKADFAKIFEDSFFKVNVETEIHSSNLFNKQ